MQKAVSYWDKQEPSYNGVLGGFGFVSDIDVRDSRQLLEKVTVWHVLSYSSLAEFVSVCLSDHEDTTRGISCGKPEDSSPR